jgi:hypothetical protein
MKKLITLVITSLCAAACDGGAAKTTAVETCTAARAQLLGAIETSSTGAVAVLGEEGAVASVYVDATAGGSAAAAMNPWTYIDLGARQKAALSDVEATGSTAWDLAIKRSGLFTNGGDAGPGQGGAVHVDEEFALVTAAHAAAASLAEEALFDADCNPHVDETGAAKTTFAGWYAYDEATHMLAPAPGTWIVRGGTGHLYKVRIETYYAAAGGGAGTGPGGNFRLQIAALD